MLKYLILPTILLSLIGCSATQIKEAEYTQDGYVIAARTKQVEVHALRSAPFRTTDGAWLDIWQIRLANNDQEHDWCASIEWRHKDYQMQVANAWFHLPPNSEMQIGSAVQEVWNFTGTVLALDDAAFSVYSLNVLKPTNGQCVVKTN